MNVDLVQLRGFWLGPKCHIGSHIVSQNALVGRFRMQGHAKRDFDEVGDKAEDEAGGR